MQPVTCFTQRIGRRDVRMLPEAKDIWRMLKEGTIFVLMFQIYFTLPLLIMEQFLQWNWIKELWTLLVWIWEAVRQQPHDTFWMFLSKQAAWFLAGSLAAPLYTLVVTPIFVAASVHYALTGRIRSFFKLFSNLGIVFRHFGRVLLFLIVFYVAGIALAIAIGVLAPTGIGALIVLPMVTAYFWIVTYPAGKLAAAICVWGKIKSIRVPVESEEAVVSSQSQANQAAPAFPGNMVRCNSCGKLAPATHRYCLYCGSRTETAALAPADDASVTAVPSAGRWQAASLGERLGAFVLDCLICVAGAPLVFIPVLGDLLYQLLWLLFWLGRDISGASPGKAIFGLKVVRVDGSAASTGQKLLRNLPFALDGILFFIPYLGLLVSGLLSLFVVAPLEGILLLATRKRLGDRMAATIVVKVKK